MMTKEMKTELLIELHEIDNFLIEHKQKPTFENCINFYNLFLEKKKVEHLADIASALQSVHEDMPSPSIWSDILSALNSL
jgi:hypothetical protein